MKTTTIAALASAPGMGGVAVIRLSGPLSFSILSNFFVSEPSSLNIQARKLYYGKLFDEHKNLLDECLAVWMKGPHSFTGEDVVEFHLHGGKLISKEVLQFLFRQGIQPAEAGEFSQRAFLNGKMDLTQAEAIADMIASRSRVSLKLAQAQWSGNLSSPVFKLRENLLELLVQLEAAVDFPEEEIELLNAGQLKPLLENAFRQIVKWLEDYETGRMLREGALVALVGKPNVGKSSLLNQLSEEEIAIVHSEAGTTRDAIEKTLHFSGFTFRFVDTAGIREAKSEVEKIGIQKSQQLIGKADLLFILLDGSQALTDEDDRLLSSVQAQRILLIQNKSDLSSCWSFEEFFLKYPHLKNYEHLSISAKEGLGISSLKEKLLSLLKLEDFENEEQLFFNQIRHQQALLEAKNYLMNALSAIEKSYSPEFISSDILAACSSLGEIVGEVSTENILEQIFSRFCIGK